MITSLRSLKHQEDKFLILFISFNNVSISVDIIIQFKEDLK